MWLTNVLGTSRCGHCRANRPSSVNIYENDVFEWPLFARYRVIITVAGSTRQCYHFQRPDFDGQPRASSKSLPLLYLSPPLPHLPRLNSRCSARPTLLSSQILIL